ncbi:MAG TPA: tetratricopeptide repeat protein, partial [bacterium]|nr:tetratricopeptide repeat protein [bacterium]
MGPLTGAGAGLRTVPVLALALALLAGTALAPLAGTARAQAAPDLTLAEVQAIAAVRQLRASGDSDKLIPAAQDYLKKFPKGNYADEALLALGEGLAAKNKPQEALAVYQRLIHDHPDSAFVDEATVATLPLLQETGQQKEALARVDELATANRASLQRNSALLWKADTLYAQKDYALALGVLGQFTPGDELSPPQHADYYRIQGLALWDSGQHQAAVPALTEYLRHDDAPERKAQALMLLGQAAEDDHHPDQALADYQQVVERYPAPDFLPEAQYRRAQVYAQSFIGSTDDEMGKARLRQAVAYYGDYINGKDARFLGPALQQRAALLMQSGRDEEALQDYDRLTSLGDPYRGDPAIIRQRVALLRKLKRDDEAGALLASVAKDPAIPSQVRREFLVDQAAFAYDHKQCAQVEALLQPMPVFSDEPVRRRAFFMRGFCRYQRGQWEQASYDFEELINDPAYEKLVVPALLESYDKSGQYPRLVRLAEDQLATGKLQPSEALLTQLAHAYGNLGEPERILEVYARLAEINPQALQTQPVQLAMGLAEEARGKPDAAREHYQAVLT